MRAYIIYLLLAFWVCSNSFGFAQTLLKGTVLDAETQHPLLGANLYLQSDLMGGTFTDEAGAFELTFSRRDTLYLSYIGYEEFSQVIEPQQRGPLLIRLQPNAQLIQTVEVKAKRLIAEEFATESLSQLDIYLNPNAKADALLAVQSLASSTNVDETANISLRGSPAFETGIFLNNVPIRDVVRLDQVNGLGQFSIFNTALLESTTVFPSNPPTEFGNTAAGVVALNLEEDIPVNKNTVSLFLAGGGYLGSRALGKRTGLTLFSNYTSHHGLKALNPNAFEFLQSIESLDLGLYLIHHFKSGSKLKFFNYSLREQYQYLFEHPSYTGPFNQKKIRNLSIINFSHQWEHSRLELNQSLNLSTSNYTTGNLDMDVDATDHFTSLNYHWFKDQWSVKTGLAVDANQEAFDAISPEFGHAFAPHHPTYRSALANKIWNPQGFLYIKHNWNEALTIGGGIRYYAPLNGRQALLDKQLNTTLNLSSFQRLTFSVGQYHQVGIPRTNGIGRSLIIKANQYAFDYRFAREGWQLNAALYHKRSTQPTYANLIWGGEVAASFKSQNFEWSVSIARVSSKLSNEEETWESNYDLDYFIRAMVKYSIPQWMDVSLICLGRPGSYYQPIQRSQFHEITQTYIPIWAGRSDQIRYPNYRLLDLSLSKIFPLGEGSMLVFLNASNVLDIKNLRSYNYNFDYTEKTESWFGRRILFVGGTYSF